jgi:hypothetical protein
MTRTQQLRFPDWPPQRVLWEAVHSWNLRHQIKLDPCTSSWPRIFAATLAFCRHSLADYDQQLSLLERDLIAAGRKDLAERHLQERNALRARIHAAARRQYQWLRPDIDPRRETQLESELKEDPRILTRASAQLADLVSERAQLLSAISQLKRQRPLNGKERVAEMQAELTRVEKAIENRRRLFLTAPELAGVEPRDSREAKMRLLIWGHEEPVYLFGGRELPESHTKSAGFKCPACCRTVLRSKREVDLGAGIKLVALSCVCRSIVVTREYSYPSAEIWGDLIEQKGES